jgi:hypothetical protein
MAKIHFTAIYFNILSARIFVISNSYLNSEGESALAGFTLIISTHTAFQSI